MDGANGEDASFTWANLGGGLSPNGSGGWFAPEVYRRGRKTKAVDLFSLGSVAGEWVEFVGRSVGLVEGGRGEEGGFGATPGPPGEAKKPRERVRP